MALVILLVVCSIPLVAAQNQTTALPGDLKPGPSASPDPESQWREVYTLLQQFEEENHEFKSFVEEVLRRLGSTQNALTRMDHTRHPTEEIFTGETGSPQRVEMMKSACLFLDFKIKLNRIARLHGVVPHQTNRLTLEVCVPGPSNARIEAESGPTASLRGLVEILREMEDLKARFFTFYADIRPQLRLQNTASLTSCGSSDQGSTSRFMDDSGILSQITRLHIELEEINQRAQDMLMILTSRSAYFQ